MEVCVFCYILVDCLLQAVLRAFALVLARRSTVGDEDVVAHLKERFELFSTVMCDAIVGWVAVRGREAKHSRRFLRVSIYHFRADVGLPVENDANNGGTICSASCGSSGGASAAILKTAFEPPHTGQGDCRESSIDARLSVAVHVCDTAGEGQAVRENSDVMATQTSCTKHNELAAYDEDEPAQEVLYLGVALEEQFMCEWSGLRIPAILSGMLTALSTPVDVMLEALSCAAVLSDDAAAAVFAELESVCVGRAGDADAVCDAIVSKRSVHGAGLDIGLLRLWLRRLPAAVSVECVASLFPFVV